jgi:hypothetical protein
MVLSVLGDSKNALRVKVPYNEAVIKALRVIPGRRWSAEEKVWLIPDTRFHCKKLLSVLYDTGLFNCQPDREDDNLKLEDLYCSFHEAARAGHINTFLTHLATDKRVSPSTQNQALSALLFLYRYVLEKEIDDIGPIIKAQKPKRLPVVLSKDEVRQVITKLSGD